MHFLKLWPKQYIRSADAEKPTIIRNDKSTNKVPTVVQASEMIPLAGFFFLRRFILLLHPWGPPSPPPPPPIRHPRTYYHLLPPPLPKHH